MKKRGSVYFAIVLSVVALGFLIVSCQLTLKKPSPAAPAGVGMQIDRPDLMVKKVGDVRELCIGNWAQGAIGDYVLQNSKVRVIVADVGRVLGKAQSGGNIIDVADRKDNLDYFGQLYCKYSGANIVPYAFTKAEIRAEGYPNGAGALVVTGQDVNTPGILIKQEYILAPNDTHLTIVTTVQNNTTGTLEKTELGDEVEWGGLGVFAGGYGISTRPGPFETESDWISGFMDDYSVGIAVGTGKIKGYSMGNISELTYNAPQIPVGGSARFERYLVVADKNLSRISDFTYQLRKEPFGFVAGKVVDVNTKQGVADVDVRILTNRIGGVSVPARPFTRCYSDADGSFRMIVPVGSYFISKSAFARQVAATPLSFDIAAGATHVAELQVSYQSMLKYRIVDADTNELIPAKMTFIAIPPTRFVDFGPPFKAEGTRNVYYAAKGEGEIAVPSGRYKVIVSRGIEYDTFEKEVGVLFKDETALEAKLRRVVDTSGYVSLDLGVRTNESYDCLVTKEDRVIGAVGEGVEYVISGESNRGVDLNPTIDALGLSRLIKAGIGKKIDFWRGNSLGEFLVYPVAAESEAVDVPEEIKAADPTQFCSVLRRKYPGALIQVNRAIFPEFGYFTKFGYGAVLAEIRDKNFSYDFDAIELVEGKRLGAVEKTAPLYFQLLKSGHHCVPTGSSNARFVYGEELGCPRTYVAVPTDDPSKLDDAAIAQALRSGNIQITNGPFVKFTVNGKPPGSLVTDTDGIIDCKLEVFAAPWVDAYSIYVNKDGSFVKMIWQPGSMGVRRYPKEGSTTDTGEFQLRADKDLLVNIEVKGKKSLDPIIAPFAVGEGGGVLPYAVTAPIYIDADGNGKYDPPEAQ